MRTLLKKIALALSLLYACPDVSVAGIIGRIPFELGGDSRIYVRCRVNDSDTLRFLFDTGATDMVMNPLSPASCYTMEFDSAATNTGASGSGQVRTSSSNTFFVGDIVAEDLRFLEISYPPDLWDGVIGLSFIRKYPMRIDYGTREIIIYERDGFEPPEDAVALPVKYVLGVPAVPAAISVNGRYYELEVEVDTGSDRVFDLNTPFVKENDLLHSQKPFAVSRISSSDPGTGELLNVFFDYVDIGGMRLFRIPGAFSTLVSGVQASDSMDGVMGNSLLQRFNITLDMENGLIWLEPNDLMYKPFYDFLIY